jgi:hypothetical protein
MVPPITSSPSALVTGSASPVTPTLEPRVWCAAAAHVSCRVVSRRVASRTGDHGFVDRGAAVGDAAVDRDVRAREDLEEVVPLHQIGVDLPLAHHLVPALLRAPTTRHGTTRHTAPARLVVR